MGDEVAVASAGRPSASLGHCLVCHGRLWKAGKCSNENRTQRPRCGEVASRPRDSLGGWRPKGGRKVQNSWRRMEQPLLVRQFCRGRGSTLALQSRQHYSVRRLVHIQLNKGLGFVIYFPGPQRGSPGGCHPFAFSQIRDLTI